MMFHSFSPRKPLSGIGGMGDTCVAYDDIGDCLQYEASPSDVIGSVVGGASGSTPIPVLNPSPTVTPTGNASTGFNWGGWFASIFPTIAADATKIGQQALASPGTVITPGGTIAVGTAQGQPSLLQSMGFSSVGTTNLTPILLLGGGALLLVMAMKR